MLTLYLTYFAIGLAALAVLTRMILRIGALMSDCPETPGAQTATLTIATGYAAIGLGGLLVIGAALPFMGEVTPVALMVALGLATLCLGLGFTQAIATMRAVLTPPASTSAPTPEPRPAPTRAPDDLPPAMARS